MIYIVQCTISTYFIRTYRLYIRYSSRKQYVFLVKKTCTIIPDTV